MTTNSSTPVGVATALNGVSHHSPHNRYHHSPEAMHHKAKLAAMTKPERLVHEFGGTWEAISEGACIGHFPIDSYGEAIASCLLKLKPHGYKIEQKTNGDIMLAVTGDIEALLHDVEASIIRAKLAKPETTLKDVLQHQLAHTTTRDDWGTAEQNRRANPAPSPARE